MANIVTNQHLTRPNEIPVELAQFGDYNAAIVAFRYVRSRANQVPIERWVEAAKWAAVEPTIGEQINPIQRPSLMAVLDRLGLTKSAKL